MAIVNMNAFYTVLRKAEKSLSLLPSKCESLNTLSLKSKMNYLNMESKKLRKELTRAVKRLNDKDTFIMKLMREKNSLKAANEKLATENKALRYKVSKSDERFLEVRLKHTLSLKTKDEHITTYKKKMEEKFEKCVSNYERKLTQKEDYILELKSRRNKNTNDSVGAAPPTESDYESEEVWLPAEKCAIYPAAGWLECKQKTCSHRHAPVRTRQKSNRLKKKKGPTRSNIKKDDLSKELLKIKKSREEYDSQRGEFVRLSMGYHKDPEKAYADLIDLSNRMHRTEDPRPRVQKGVGSTSWLNTDVD
jgi:hypothetical protein